MKNLSFFVSVAALFAVNPVVAAESVSQTPPNCADLGFTTKTSLCGRNYNVCPFDKNLAICIAGPAVGDIKYSLVASNHDGWLLCNGGTYDVSKYPELKTVLTTRGFDSGKLPDYQGYFLRGYTSSATSKNTYAYNPNTSLTTPQKEQLPNITGTWTDSIENQKYQAPTGAISQTGKSGNGIDGNGGWFGHMKFDASKTSGTGNGVYKEYGHVIPASYAAYVFIYAGK